jgi:glucan 1,3-beta-glucosidase
MVSHELGMSIKCSLIPVTGYNDCGLFLKGTGSYTPSYGDCTAWNDWASWDQPTRDGVQNFALASMDALGDFFFWTWKVR